MSSAKQKIIQLFRKHRVITLQELKKHLKGRSRRSLFRDLSEIDYYSSFTHAGQYYTLKEIPRFDSNGLWFFRDIGFSRHGNLKETLIHFIETSNAGMKHGEVKDRLRIQVFNTLLDLVSSGNLKRVKFEKSYLYVSAKEQRMKEQIHAAQLRKQASRVQKLQISEAMVIEILAEVIRQHDLDASPLKVAARLSYRGVRVSFEQVKNVLEYYEVKKTPPTSWFES